MFLNVNTPKSRASKYLKQNEPELKGKIEKEALPLVSAHFSVLSGSENSMMMAVRTRLPMALVPGGNGHEEGWNIL